MRANCGFNDQAAGRRAARLVLATLVVVLAACSALAATTGHREQEIFLPDDCDVLTIKGNGFQLRFEEIKKNWGEVAEESARVDVPRHEPHEHGGPDGAGADGQTGAHPDDSAVVNENLYERVKQEAAESSADYGLLDQDLFEWISTRARLLMSRIERYSKEAQSLRSPQRIVVDILLLNTLVDLDNLKKEDIGKLRWVGKRLSKLLREFVHKEASAHEVSDYVHKLIDANKIIESKVRGTNDPGKQWITNTKALRRVLHEQRYSESLGQVIVEYLGSPFNMMKRSVLFDINRRANEFDDGLYYYKARGIVPSAFPFPSQDAISHGDD